MYSAREIEIHSFELLRKFADEFRQKLRPGALIFLNGPLGSGKTTFVRNLVAGFGINETASPSFTLINEYKGGGLRFAHADFYRLKSAPELFEIGFHEYLESEDILIIEWAELYKDSLPVPDFILQFSNESDATRKVTLYEH